jgi:hypothetical protein
VITRLTIPIVSLAGAITGLASPISGLVSQITRLVAPPSEPHWRVHGARSRRPEPPWAGLRASRRLSECGERLVTQVCSPGGRSARPGKLPPARYSARARGGARASASELDPATSPSTAFPPPH